MYFVGYADPNSPAGQVRKAEQGSEVHLTSGGAPVKFNCHREVFTFSAHARRDDLLSYAIKVRPKTILLVHGDDPAIEWFKRELYAALPDTKVIAPPPGQAIEL
jgi:Cft2 family RNA processing exonuclease